MSAAAQKLCTACQTLKPLSDFTTKELHKGRRILSSHCRACATKASARRRSRSITAQLRHLYTAIKQRRHRHPLAITVDDLIALWHAQQGRCAVTGRPMTHIQGRGRLPTNVSVDRIDPTKGYSPDNIQLVCVAVNLMKASLTMAELKDWCRAVLHGDDLPPSSP